MPRLVRMFGLVAGLWLLSFHAVFAQQDDVTLPIDDVAAWVDGFVPHAIRQAKIAGAVVVVVDRSGVVFQRGYGLSDWDAGTAVDPERTLFRPGSISKLFVWTAVMQQVERGAIDLDADINTYLDFEIPPFDGQPITMRQVMTHTAGFEEALRYLFVTDPMPLEDYVKQALPARVFAPGSTTAYSNYATSLAGYVVERVSGQSFDAYVAENIFAPLGMDRSTFAQPLPDELADQMSQRYNEAGGPALGFEMFGAAPAGALTASGADIGRFMVAQLNDGAGLLRPETARMMQDYRAPGIEGLNRMALGFYEKRVNGHRGIGHGGDTQGFHSDLTIFPDAGVGLYISMNSSGVGAERLAIRHLLLEGFADRYLPPRGPQDVVPGVDAETARAHAELVAGSYYGTRASFTNFLSLLGFLGQANVGVTEEGELSFPVLYGLGIGAPDWVEVVPFIWQDRYSSSTVAAEVVDGEVVRLSTDIFSPFMELIPAPPGRNAAVLAPVLGAALFVILLQAVLWPVRRIVRGRMGVPFALQGGHLTVYRATGLFGWGVVLAVLGWVAFGAIASSDPALLGGDLDWLMNGLRVLTPVAAVGLSLAAVAHFLMSLQAGRSWFAHVGRLALLLSALMLVWAVMSFHLYGFDLRF
ncbi:serine hydrolase domain-containing protein [Yoonia sp. 2307UL14-13]|uniref:serine hydrolase domain-containing protein n=1 Tax=Yoonia sp. 2307UL14-13 TaxID=3126506 RepID=UPI00309E738B